MRAVTGGETHAGETSPNEDDCMQLLMAARQREATTFAYVWAPAAGWRPTMVHGCGSRTSLP